MIGFHVTFESNFDSIAENGLIPRDTTKHNWPSIRNEIGVYFWTKFRAAEHWAQWGMSEREYDFSVSQREPRAVIIFKIDEEFVRYDRVYQDDTCRFTMTPVPPEDLIDVIPL